MTLTAYPVSTLNGEIRAPGDKSCSHRALIMGGLAKGTTHISGLLEGDDVLRTGEVMQALGASVTQTGKGRWTVTGVGEAGLTSPAKALDFGNSGTGVRLMMGVLAGHDLTAELIGDESLSARPMKRVTGPLSDMGAAFSPAGQDKLPLTIEGRANLKPLTYTPPYASAQVKSAILLAALRADGLTRVTEPRKTRDHTERMLRHFGVEIDFQPRTPGDAYAPGVRGGQQLIAADAIVPGDPSSAAFLTAAAIISPQAEIMINGVMSNDTRDGFFEAATLMGAQIGAEEGGEATGERQMTLQVSSSNLQGVRIPERIVPSMIDEFPILSVLAAYAAGETKITGAAELRVKESDRITAIVSMLRANGVGVEELEDGLVIEGCGGPPPGGGHVETRHDHRIAMSALIMGTASQQPVTIDDASMIATSYPDFLSHMRSLGADIH